MQTLFVTGKALKDVAPIRVFRGPGYLGIERHNGINISRCGCLDTDYGNFLGHFHNLLLAAGADQS